MGILRTSILLPLLFLSGLSCFIAPAKAYLAVHVLYNGVQTNNYTDYVDSGLFTGHFVNTGSTITGYLSNSIPRNACSPLSPLPSTNATWILLVSDYPSCPLRMINNTQNAGYDLIIVYNDSHRDLSNISQFGFPVVNIAEKYALYLQANALANSTDDPITISVETSTWRDILAIVFLTCGPPVFFCVCFFVLCCYGCCRHGTNQRRATVNRHYAEIRIQRDRLAQQALVQSILRQLQELQLDLSLQVPLGAAETARLNTRPFTAEESKEEQACAICVDDFSEGETVKVLPCDHIFHPQCIDEWLNRHSSLCPLCKADVRQASSGGGAAPTNSGQPAHLRSGMINMDTDSTDSDSTSSRSEDALLLPRTSRTLPGYGSVQSNV